MSNRLKLSISLICFLFPVLLSAQESSLGNWWIYFGNKKINDRFNWHHEVQYRNYNFIGDLEQLLLRTGIGYNLTPNNNNLLLGYGYINSENYIGSSDEKIAIGEHRLYQQFITKQQFGSFSLQHRYRFEQRWVSDDFRTRFRYFLSFNWPIYYSKTKSDQHLYLSGYNEIFIVPTDRPFDRNRIYGGMGYKFSKSLRLEFGYMNQIFGSTSRDQLNMIAFVGF